MRRVVVTGVGMLTALGTNAKDSWEAILDGKSGVTNISKWRESMGI